ncbi:13021_t:CDS:2, partial [Entrophospora sp. SA101]
KSVITLLLLLACPTEAIYDISIVIIKYQEGYLPGSSNQGEYKSKPQSLWSKENQDFVVPINYVLCATLSVQTAILFPTLQFFFSSNQLNSEIAPQFAYGIIMLIIALLGFRSDHRFKKLLMQTRRLNPTVNVLSKLNYFRYMNQYLTLGLLSGSASLTVLSIDGLTTAKYLNTTKIYADLLMAQLNFSIWAVRHMAKEINKSPT